MQGTLTSPDIKRDDNSFYVCPECNESDGIISMDTVTFSICLKHKNKWVISLKTQDTKDSLEVAEKKLMFLEALNDARPEQRRK